jgi:hypothetical protein
MRTKTLCTSCEQYVYTDADHSCHDAKALRAVRDAEAAVVRTGLAWFAALELIRTTPYSVSQSIGFRAKESDHRDALQHLRALHAARQGEAS